jgi:hypothetical protein
MFQAGFIAPNESIALADVCFEVARVLTWSDENLIASAEIGSLAESLNLIAMKRVHERDTLGIDVPGVTRTVACLTRRTQFNQWVSRQNGSVIC